MPAARYRKAVTDGALTPDAGQARAVEALDALAHDLKHTRPRLSLTGRRRPAPRGLYIWGDVGRGKSMLMDLFFESAPVKPKLRRHFNVFMQEVHARLHEARARPGTTDPILPVARALAAQAKLLCFDEFQVGDVADAMILGRLFEQLFAAGTVIVATSNTPPDRLYEGGLNRQLFLPFIAEIKTRLAVIELNGPRDYRLERLAGRPVYLTPLGPEADAALDAAWARLTDGAPAKPLTLIVLGRKLVVPRAARGVARFSFADLCEKPLAGADYLAVARDFHTVLIDHIPLLDESRRNEARRLMLLIDTLYDEGVKLICSAAAPPAALYPAGDGAQAFRRAASRLAEMRSLDYLRRGHGLHGSTRPSSGQAVAEGNGGEPEKVGGG